MKNNRFPIGEFHYEGEITLEQVRIWINEIEVLPEKIIDLVQDIDENTLNNTYRAGGWTIRQIIHHIVDSHMNSYVRFKWAITEDNPTIKTYDQESWAELIDYQMEIEDSLLILKHLHIRWTFLLKNLTEEQLQRTFNHPDSGIITLKENIGIYAWHGNHHLEHIKIALKQ